jgi:AcrR family transcriptional regulator
MIQISARRSDPRPSLRPAVPSPPGAIVPAARFAVDSRAMRRKLEILKHAAAAFRNRGYAATSVRDIARRAGMTPGNLYYYFRNKRDILCFCQDTSLDVLLREARRIRGLRMGIEETIRALLRFQVLCMLDEMHGSAAHIEFHAIPRPRLRRIIRKRDAYERIVRAVVAEGTRAGLFAARDSKLVTLAMLGAVNWTARWYRPGGGRTPEAIADAFADYLVRGLRR